MIEIIKKSQEKIENIIRMRDMRPLQIAEVVDRNTDSFGHIVMRTASLVQFEVMSLTSPGEDECWSYSDVSLKVRLLNEDEYVDIRISNKNNTD